MPSVQEHRRLLRGTLGGILAILVGIALAPKMAAAEGTATAEAAGLRAYLTPDGTLDLEALRQSGSDRTVDLAGYRMTLDTDRGAIRADLEALTGSKALGDENWWDGFGSPGVSDRVWALAVYGGALIVAGEFHFAGGVPARCIARWDGGGWSALGGTGLNGGVRALHLYDGKLIAGGWFTQAGGIPAQRIAQWDGVQWAPLGTGFDADVWVLGTYGGQLIAGGDFIQAGGVTVNRIARWDGTAWSAMGTGADGKLSAFVQFGPDLIAGGWFEQIGGLPIRNVARWNGATWSALGSWSRYEVNALAVYQNQLYAGGWGAFAIWTGTEWSYLDVPLGGVQALLPTGGSLIAAGWNWWDDGAHVYTWDGTSWAPLGSGLRAGDAHALAVFDGRVIVGGRFWQAGNLNVLHIASWDGSAWAALGASTGQGIGGMVHALATYRGEVYAGGYFRVAGGTPVAGIARWDGAAWHPLGDGIAGWSTTVHAMIVFNGELIVAGDFEFAGGVRVNHIARWNGAQWGAIGGGTDCGHIRALAVFRGDLIAGGDICLWGTPTAWRVLRWDGFAWNAVGDWPETCQPRALTVWNDRLVVGGCFTVAEGAPGEHIAAWDGTSWAALGDGINGEVCALANYQGHVIAGGFFNMGNGADCIARWNGLSWGPFGGSFGGGVRALAVIEGDLYAGGEVGWAGGLPVSGIARYDGYAWNPLGSGLTNRVEALTADDDPSGAYLYLGGEISWAGNGLPSAGIARWRRGGPTGPVLTAVSDVPNDQGRQVRLRWRRSRYDAPGQPVTITGYAVFREQNGNKMSANSGWSREEGDSPTRTDLRLDGWDYLMTVPAFGDTAYQCVAPTLCDSTISGGLCLSTFLVRAVTPSPFEYFDSAPLSGYSLDNLAPAAPRNLRFENPALLAWEEAPEADFDFFSVYGSPTATFDTQTATLIGHTTNPEMIVAGLLQPFLHVTTTDFAGNEGEASAIANQTVGVDLEPARPARFALHPCRPNPSVGPVHVRFDLPEEAHVLVRVIDVAGRERATLISGRLPAGSHEADWSPRATGDLAPTGLYFLRLEAGSFLETRKVLLIGP